MPSANLRDPLESAPLFLRFRIPGATLPNSDVPVPDLLARSYEQTFQCTMREKIQRTKTKGGWVQEHWRPELDTISLQGLTGGFIMASGSRDTEALGKASPNTLAAFYSLQSPEENQTTDTEPDFGLATGNQVIFRRLTNPAINLEAVIHLYRNNGATYNPDGKISALKNVEMYHMKSVYTGYFTDFNHSHSDQSPNLFTYSFTFKVLDVFMS